MHNCMDTFCRNLPNSWKKEKGSELTCPTCRSMIGKYGRNRFLDRIIENIVYTFSEDTRITMLLRWKRDSPIDIV